MEYTGGNYGDDVPGAIAAIRSNLDEIKTGDCSTTQTYFYLPENDNDPQEQATIFALEHNGVLLFDTNGYNKAQDAYSFRLNTLWLIGALLFLLRGFDILKSKTSWITAIAIAIALLVLRLLEIW